MMIVLGMLVYADIADLAVLTGSLLTSLQKLDKALLVLRYLNSLLFPPPLKMSTVLQEPKMKDCACFNNT